MYSKRCGAQYVMVLSQCIPNYYSETFVMECSEAGDGSDMDLVFNNKIQWLSLLSQKKERKKVLIISESQGWDRVRALVFSCLKVYLLV